MTWTAVEARLTGVGPTWPDSLLGHLVATAVPGVEEWRDGAYRRILTLADGPAVVAVRPGTDVLPVRLLLTDPADEAEAIALARRLLDLDRDTRVVDAHLSRDPVLAPLVAAALGRRVPGLPDVGEAVVRAVLGQQVSTAAARTHAGRLAEALGEPVVDPEGGLTRAFPTAAAVADAPDELLRLPARRRDSLRAAAAVVAAAPWGRSPDPAEVVAALDPVPGIGPWTTGTAAMRALGDPDVLLAGDLGLRAAARGLGLPDAPRPLTARAEVWQPYRSYAVQHLWGVLDHPINTLPAHPA
ncbi:hypothetical protein GCM10022199_25020 [Marihabitans asiaticum]|uniref:DNA-3-methyladenine glycosylase II n=1 Tax=Marihabitans asiaticum TaxID=415218 RepID=A0A560W9H6_9MICO|nr:AlkA N-terminal domain-containing protein [Marihabitans asiaticum]TWD14278.1 DNA-3-methyladenine glycosylase II [Marihabitans asiaticum]